MTSLSAPSDLPPDSPDRSAKRQQILEGARRRFMADGFEAASMGEIAREAGVSKGTLYVYFDSKESLFTALVEETKRQSVERLIDLPEDAPDLRATLTELALVMIGKISTPEHVAMLRMVIGVGGRFPAPARSFFQAGPLHGRKLLSDYLSRRAAEGRIRVDDPEIAAWQFMALCAHPVTTGVLVGCQPPPTPEEAEQIARAAVSTFLAANPLLP